MAVFLSPHVVMAFGLIIIGDEILSGKRQDRHFEKVRDILSGRGLRLAWVAYLGDDRERLTDAFRKSLSSNDVVLSCGGIGATPDDHTRQAAAEAACLPLRLHPEAERLIIERTLEVNLPITPGRLQMGEFPEGATIIPNPYNRIPGFSLYRHHFFPGFPEMAWPMIEWVLDTYYRDLFQSEIEQELAMTVCDLAEATLTPLMLKVEATYPELRVFSLPRLNPQQRTAYEIELGVKGAGAHMEAAFDMLRRGVLALGGQIA